MEKKTNIMKLVMVTEFPEDYLTEVIDKVKNTEGTVRCSVESISGDGMDYDMLVVERENQSSMFNGTACRVEYDESVPAKEMAEEICKMIDEMI